jgi:hypothetical protein
MSILTLSYPGKAPRKQLATKAARKTAAAVSISFWHLRRRRRHRPCDHVLMVGFILLGNHWWR